MDKMRTLLQKIPYLNKRIAQNNSLGQSLVEFALISMVLFTLILTILEGGRLMFLFTQVSSAAQEGSRYGFTHPLELISTADDGPPQAYPPITHNNNPCNVVAQARSRVVLVPPQDVDVTMGYDGGDQNTPMQGVIANYSVGVDRIVVTTTYHFHFLLPLFDAFVPPSGLPLTMVSARTIGNNEQTPPTPGACTYDPGSGGAPPPPTPTTGPPGPTNTPGPGPTDTPSGPTPTPAGPPPPTPTPCAPVISITTADAKNTAPYSVALEANVTVGGVPATTGVTVTYFIASGGGSGSLVYSGTPGKYWLASCPLGVSSNVAGLNVTMIATNACNSGGTSATIALNSNPTCP
ncbi:MAG TPA: TadE family protein [Chloroflexia bacterium]|nr:TadE family protein [Chloroflexia bacterium]